MKKKKPDRLWDLIPDAEKRKRIEEALYSDEPLFGPGSVFSELLQGFINASLEGELDIHLRVENQEGRRNRRNGHLNKEVKSMAGNLEIKTPRDPT